MGSDQRCDYTCLSDGVKLAARLKGQSKPYAIRVIIGPQIAEHVGDTYQVVELNLIAVKDKAEPAWIFTVGEKCDTAAEETQNSFLEAYRSGQWGRATTMANKLVPLWKGELKATKL
jgi:adenylate cyclase